MRMTRDDNCSIRGIMVFAVIPLDSRQTDTTAKTSRTTLNLQRNSNYKSINCVFYILCLEYITSLSAANY